MSAVPAMIETELWLSFVSMLRSYAAAASLHAGEVRVSTTETTAKVAFGDARLDLRFDPESSQAAWSRHSGADAPTTGNCIFRPEGTIEVNGAIKDLDHAAIDFLASITAEGKGSRR